MRLSQRISALEGHNTGVTLGEIMDMFDRQDAGETINWAAIEVSPELAASLDGLGKA